MEPEFCKLKTSSKKVKQANSARADSPGLFYFWQGRPLEASGPLIASEYGPLRRMAGYALLGRGEKYPSIYSTCTSISPSLRFQLSCASSLLPSLHFQFSLSLSFAAFANIFFYSNVVFILPSILSPPADPPWSNRTLVGDPLPSQ